MTLNTVFIKTYAPPAIDEREILRYAGYRGQVDEQIQMLLKECLAECLPCLSYRVCYRAYNVETLKSLLWESETLNRALQNSEIAVVFAASVGLGLDRLIQKYSVRSTAKALLFQAIGAERIESLCDTFCKELSCANVRVSPGYGDLPLESQKRIFLELDCFRKIGVSLTDGYLMSPTKSVTAIVGIANAETATGCQACEKKDCEFRKEE